MDAWLTRMFERHGSRYVKWYLAACVFEVLFIAAPVVAFFPARYEGLGFTQWLATVAVADGTALIVYLGCLTMLGRELRNLIAWAGTRDDTRGSAARRTAFEAPRRTMLLSVMIGVPLVPALVAILAVPHHHTSALDLLELSIGAVAAVVGIALNTQFTLEVMVRPIRAALASDRAAEQRPTSLLVRLALSVPALTWVGGSAVAFLTTTRARAGAGHLLVVYGIAVAVTAICLLFIVPLLSSGVADPVSDLIRATRAVAEGRLDTRVPVTTTDELGELAHSFNQMLEEIRATRVRIVAASDAARRAVERDLHDGAQQRLVLLKLKLNMLEREPDRTELIAEIRNELDHALDELRDLARGIYPPLLENEGLTGALRDVADRATMPVELSCNGTGRYPAEIEAAVYFCCLEALQNTAKHAGDHAHALIHLSERDHTLEFEVRDDGVGFQATNGGLSSGLQNMRDRLGALGGLLNVSSAPGAGTTIKGSVPL